MVTITNGNMKMYARVDENCAIIIKDLQWLKHLLINTGASQLKAKDGLRIIDSKTGERFEVKYLGVDND